MTEQLKPQAGEIWEHALGAQRFVGFVGSYTIIWHSTIETREDKHKTWAVWAAGAKRVFPPVPAPVGETITVECCIIRKDDDDGNVDHIAVYGQSICTADEFARSVRPDPYIGKFSVKVPKSLLSVPVLPAVTVTEEATT